MGYNVPPPGEFVNAVAHQLMGSGQSERAQYFFQLNIDNYSESFKPYEVMGVSTSKKETT